MCENCENALDGKVPGPMGWPTRWDMLTDHGKDLKRFAGPYPEMNVALIEQALKWAEFTAGTEGHPAWVQSDWFIKDIHPGDTLIGITGANSYNVPENYCGTSFCQAGYVLQLTGNLEDAVEDDRVTLKNIITNDLGETYDLGPQMSSSASYDWVRGGAFVLGLTYDEAEAYFEASNTLDDLKFLARKFAENRGVTINV